MLFDSKHYSRAGKASQLKFKILLDKARILAGDKSKFHRTSSQPNIEEVNRKDVVFSKLKFLKVDRTAASKSKAKAPSAVFLSPGRHKVLNSVQEEHEANYNVNYKLVHKAPVFYSISKSTRNKVKQVSPDSILSTNLHQFPEDSIKNSKGLKFKLQTSRKDLLAGQPSPHEERFNTHNLIPKSCSKFSFASTPRFDKYTERKEFYSKKEHIPDYHPNKEYVLPKITKEIVFRVENEKKIKEFDDIIEVNLNGEKRSVIEELVKKHESFAKRRSVPRLENELILEKKWEF